MTKYQCSNCNKNFKQKSQLDYHINRKNKCQSIAEISHQNPPYNHQNPPYNHQNTTFPPPKTTILPPQIITELQNVSMPTQNNNVSIPTQNNNVSIPTQNVPIPVNDDSYTCTYCNKSFARRDVVNKHMKQSCKVLKQQDKDRKEIFDKLVLLEEKNKQLEEEIKNKNRVIEDKDKVIENKDKVIENKDKQLEKVIENKDKQLEEEIKVLKSEINNIQSLTINNNNNNNNNSNNTTNNTVNVINIVPHGQEDLNKNKVDDLLLIIATKKGYNSVLELISRVHFNAHFPEFQNVYIPDIKNNTAMVFNQQWELMNIEDVITNLHDAKSDYIMDNKDIFYKHLNVGEQIVYGRWEENNNNRDSAEFKEYIADVHKKIKLLMYNKREMVIANKKLQKMKKNKISLNNIKK